LPQVLKDNDLGNLTPTSAAKSGAVLDDPDLARVVEAWPELPDWTKNAIITLVLSSGGR
jgi:hypothetical protein